MIYEYLFIEVTVLYNVNGFILETNLLSHRIRFVTVWRKSQSFGLRLNVWVKSVFRNGYDRRCYGYINGVILNYMFTDLKESDKILIHQKNSSYVYCLNMNKLDLFDIVTSMDCNHFREQLTLKNKFLQ